MDNIFTNIYETCEWGNNQSSSYKGSSGGGSSVEYNIKTYVPFMKKFITEKNIRSVVDLGCGDFLTGPYIYNDLPVVYNGYDAYEKVVNYNKSKYPFPKYNFTHLDFYNNKETIVTGDMCILKDVLQHWSLTEIYNFLDYLVESKKFKYILICNCCHQERDETDITTGAGHPLSCDFLPLKKYNPQKLYKYGTKEVSVIHC